MTTEPAAGHGRDPTAPPDDVASLMTWIARERASLSPAQQRVATYVLTNPFQVATLGIEALAEAAEVSTATVNRFAHRFGFNGYPGLRQAMLGLFRQTLDPVEKLRDRPDDTHSLVQDSLAGAVRNLTQAESFLTADACARATALVLEAEHVLVLGLGISATVARLVAELLGSHRSGVEALDGSGGPERMIPRILRLRPGDLVIAITVPRYSRLTIDLLRSARERGVHGLGLTDTPASPIVPHCDVALFGPAEHRLIHGSVTALVALAEGLAAAVASRCVTVEAATELTQRILPHLFTDDPGFTPSDR